MPGVGLSHHTLNVNFYYKWYLLSMNTSLTWKIALSLKNYRERCTQLECCYKFSIFACFADSVMYTNLQFWCVQMDTAHGNRHLVKMFKHHMLSVKIVLCLESQETILELSVPTHIHMHTRTHTHTHYVNKIIYIYGGYWVKFWHIWNVS